jgi:hypothetical protein
MLQVQAGSCFRLPANISFPQPVRQISGTNFVLNRVRIIAGCESHASQVVRSCSIIVASASSFPTPPRLGRAAQ